MHRSVFESSVAQPTVEDSALWSVTKQFEISFQRFFLGGLDRDPAEDSARRGRGLLQGGSGRLCVQTGISITDLRLTVRGYSGPPASAAEDYQDVVEVGCPVAHPEAGCGVLTWSAALVTCLPSLPGEKECPSYRVRYHRGRPAGPAGCEYALVQLWVAPMREPNTIKITSRTGRFWHPTAP